LLAGTNNQVPALKTFQHIIDGRKPDVRPVPHIPFLNDLFNGVSIERFFTE
jgi:hypothetical protein